MGSHTSSVLQAAGHDVFIVDDLSNAELGALDRIEAASGKRPRFRHLDLTQARSVKQLFADYSCDAVFHFAAKKYVSESVYRPLEYYFVNLVSLLDVLRAMQSFGVNRLVFSSSAAVYGETNAVPIFETSPIAPANPYAHSKAMAEQVIHDMSLAWPELRASVLRYFNPVGAHPSGRLGEASTQVQLASLSQACLEVALGGKKFVTVHGTDHPTPDGTAVRDFIHVMDVAEGHLAALGYLTGTTDPSFQAFNLGTGRGTSVREFIDSMSAAAGFQLPWREGPRRAGDIPISIASAEKARATLGWSATRSVAQMCVDALYWARCRAADSPTRVD